MAHSKIIRDLAAAMLAGQWEASAILQRLAESIGEKRVWMRGLVKRAVHFCGSAQAPAVHKLEAFLRYDKGLENTLLKTPFEIVKIHLTPTAMSKGFGPLSACDVPILTTDADLCRWLDLSPEHLDWFAGVFTREHDRTREPLRHYRYKWVAKRSGGWRLLEIPKSKLKEIQRRILADLLDKIPAHPHAHGFMRGGSVLNFVAPHTGHALALRMDLKDFFVSIEASRIHALFRSVGYSEHIARMLTALCTNTIPSHFMQPGVCGSRLTGSQRMQLRTPHLPQGAPTSPALANLCAFRFDARVSALAKKFDWTYTRYADDLLFSGKPFRAAMLDRFTEWIAAIAREEHFAVNPRKTRAMASSTRQHAAGLVLNTKPNIPRDEFDALKAILFNCVKHGPGAQNRANVEHFREHLLGRVGYVSHVNPARGRKLKELFETIAWSS